MCTSTPGARPIEIAVAGTGNVAWSLVPALDSLPRVRVTGVYGRSAVRAAEVARLADGAVAVTSVDALPAADIYIISVTDKAVAEIADSLRPARPHAIVAHTSGSVGIDALGRCGAGHGVFYPMQTFTRGRAVDMRTVPIFIEWSDPATARTLKELASALSANVSLADGTTRMRLHAAAVFACNFTNHLLAVSADVLRRGGLSLDVMKPLVEETLRKAFATSPDQGQTGPARRGDIATVRRHADLVGEPYKDLYLTLSQSIIDRYEQD